MKHLTGILLATLVALFCALPGTCLDVAYVNGSVGTTTVLRCIELIDDSGLFANDSEMVRRIAYVESQDGANYVGGTGGIWKVSETVLNNLLVGMNTSSLYPSIETFFNIRWENVTYEDLDIPIYSALAVRLVLASYELAYGLAIPSTVAAQYEIWNFVFQQESDTLSEEEFSNLVNAIPIIPLCPFIYRDIIFVIDNSADDLPDPDFESIKTFLIDVVDHFNISSTRTRVGIVLYAGDTQVLLYLNQGTSTSAVNSAITAMSTVRSSIVFIGLALGQAISLFDPSLGGRRADSGVARVLVLITHTNSSDNVTSQVANAASESVGIIAIGVTDEISRDELEILATGNETTHVFQASNYSTLSNITSELEDRVCEGQVLASGDRQISGSLQPGESVSFAITIPPEGKDLTLSTITGTVVNYFSATTTTPSATTYDFSLIVTVPGTSVSHSYQLPSDGSSSLIFQFVEKSQRTTNGDTILYSRIQATSATAASYSFRIGNPAAETTASIAIASAADNPSQFTDVEIAGIVLACLIFVAGVVIAVVYYWFCRLSTDNDPKKETLFTASAVPKTEEFQLVTKQEIVPDYEEIDEAPNKKPSVSADVIPITRPKTTYDGRSHHNIEDEIRNNLRMAIENNDVAATLSAMEAFRSHNLNDVDGDLIRGERLIAVHECLQGLYFAISERSIYLLEKAILMAKQKNFQRELKTELEKAEALLLNLKKIEKLMSHLDRAIKAEDTKLMEDLILQIKALSGFDSSTVEKVLETFRYRKALNRSVATRDADSAKENLKKIRAKELESALKPEVKRAEKMINELEVLETTRTKILSLSQAKVGEIRSYASPPHGVHEVMQAVYFILGYSLNEVENWKEIRALMGRTDKQRLKAQILNIDQRKVKLSQVQLAKAKIESFDTKSISEISIALGLFFNFASSVIKEVEKLNADTSASSNAPLYDSDH